MVSKSYNQLSNDHLVWKNIFIRYLETFDKYFPFKFTLNWRSIVIETKYCNILHNPEKIYLWLDQNAVFFAKRSDEDQNIYKEIELINPFTLTGIYYK